MAQGCGPRCAKYILFLFNILIWLCGGAVLGVGIWFLVDEGAVKFLHVLSVDDDSGLVRGAAIALCAVGALAFLVGFFGCCGAQRESICMLNTYAAILVILLILQIAAGIAGIVFKDRIEEELEKSMNRTVKELYGTPGREELTDAFNFTQKEFRCCGSALGPADWADSQFTKNTGFSVPESCCVLDAEGSPRNLTACRLAATDTALPGAADYVHVEGCHEQMREWVEDHAAILAGTAFGLAVIQIFAVCLACCLKSNVKSEYEYV